MQNYLPSPSLHPNDVMMTNLQNLSAGQGANTATYMSVEELPTLFMPPVNQHAQAPAPAPQQTTVYISNARQPGTELSIYSQSVESEQSLGRVEEAAKPTMTVTVGKRTSIETADSRRGSYELANTNSGAYTVQQPIFAQMSPQMPTIFPHPSESLSVPPEVPHHADPVEASINRDMGNSTMGVNPLSPAAQTLTTPTVSAAQLQALGASASSHDVTCPPGWSFSVYDSDIAQHYVCAERVRANNPRRRQVRRALRKVRVADEVPFSALQQIHAGPLPAWQDVRVHPLPRAAALHVSPRQREPALKLAGPAPCPSPRRTPTTMKRCRRGTTSLFTTPTTPMPLPSMFLRSTC